MSGRRDRCADDSKIFRRLLSMVVLVVVMVVVVMVVMLVMVVVVNMVVMVVSTGQARTGQGSAKLTFNLDFAGKL